MSKGVEICDWNEVADTELRRVRAAAAKSVEAPAADDLVALQCGAVLGKCVPFLLRTPTAPGLVAFVRNCLDPKFRREFTAHWRSSGPQDAITFALKSVGLELMVATAVPYVLDLVDKHCDINQIFSDMGCAMPVLNAGASACLIHLVLGLIRMVYKNGFHLKKYDINELWNLVVKAAGTAAVTSLFAAISVTGWPAFVLYIACVVAIEFLRHWVNQKEPWGIWFKNLYAKLTGDEETEMVWESVPENAPHGFICPITQTMFSDPVMLNGNIYERSAITHWIIEKGTDPLTRARASTFQIRPCHSMKVNVHLYAASIHLKKVSQPKPYW